jgi:hypothetical protein
MKAPGTPGFTTVRGQPKSDALSTLGKLEKERDALKAANPDDPRLADYDSAIRAEAARNGGNPLGEAIDKEVGGAVGKAAGEAITGAAAAQSRIAQRSLMRDAIIRGGDDITYGPYAEFALKGKEALGSAFGIQLAGTAPAEVVKKLNIGLAVQMARQFSSRPTQMEFVKFIEANPGLAITKSGALALADIGDQLDTQDLAIAKLAENRSQWKNGSWRETMDDYYTKHPIMAPGDHSRPLSIADLQASAPGVGSGGYTPAAPGKTTNWKIQDGKLVPAQ